VIPKHAVHPFRRMSATRSDGMSSTNWGMIGIGGRHRPESITTYVIEKQYAALANLLVM